MNVIHYALKIFSLLDKSLRLLMSTLVIAMALSSLGEVLVIGAIGPLLRFAAKGDWSSLPLPRVWGNGLSGEPGLIASILFGLIVLFAGTLRIFTLWFSGKVAARIGSTLSVRYFSRLIRQEYCDYLLLSKSSAKAALLSDVNIIIFHFILPLLNGAAACIAAAGILILMTASSPALIGIISASLVLVYSVSVLINRVRLRKLSIMQARGIDSSTSLIDYALSGFRDIVIDGQQDIVIKEFRSIESQLRLAQISILFRLGLPRISVETAAVGLFTVIIILTKGWNVSPDQFSGLLVLLFGSLKLIPFFQRIYDSWASPQAHLDSLIRVLTPPPEAPLLPDLDPVHRGINSFSTT